MIQAFTHDPAGIPLAVNQTIPLMQNSKLYCNECCNDVVHEEGTALITILENGKYKVEVTATGTTTAAGTFGVVLRKNGEDIPYAMSSTSTAAGDVASVHFGVIVKRCDCSAASLAVRYTGVEGTLTNIVVTVHRVKD